MIEAQTSICDENVIKFKVAMKIDSTPPLFNIPALAQGRSSSTAGATFSASLRNAASVASQPSKLSPTLPMSPSQSSQTGSRQVKPPSLNERALGLRAYRQELLASNIANADTPGYKAVDINVNDALRTGKRKDEVQLLYRTPAQGSADGNTVDMDVERAEFAQNGLMYEYTVDRVRGYYKMMDELLKGTPY